MILILSNLLSYSLYESKAERVTLERELNAVADLISLEKMMIAMLDTLKKLS